MSQFCPNIETSQLICCANRLTGFYIRATLIFNGLMDKVKNKHRFTEIFLFTLSFFYASVSVASLIDSMIYHSARALQKKMELGKAT